MNASFKTISLAVTILLGGCATQAQKISQQMTNSFNEASQKAEQCYQEVEANDAHSVLKEILILQNDPKALQKMSINKYLTDSEKENLFFVRELQTTCRVMALEGLATVHPDLVAFLSKWYAKADENTLALVQNKITIGEYNTIAHKNVASRTEEYNEILVSINQQLNQSHSNELAQRQAAARSLQQWSYQQRLLQQNQQMINSINRPTYTNCNYFGNTLRCSSY